MSDAVLPGKIKYKIRFACPSEHKRRFAESDCLISISVGQAKHEGEKFAATLAKVNQSFKSCTIMVADSLQRFSLKVSHLSVELDRLHQRANQDGDAWLERNRQAIESLTIPCKIIRWDEWLSDPEFNHQKTLINELYINNKDFRMSMFNTVRDFMVRRERNSAEFDRVMAYKYSAEYLIEECAVFPLLLKHGFKFIAYPGKMNLAALAIFERVVRPFSPGILQWVEIKST